MSMTMKPTPEGIVAGRQPVIEALKSGSAIEKIFILFGVKGPAIEHIRQLARQKGVPVVDANRQKFREVAADTTTQGVVAVVPTKEYVGIPQILEYAQSMNKDPLILVLDEIEDPHNLGALIRTADCAGAHGVVIPKHHAAAITSVVTKASAGATMHMLVARETNIANILEELKEKGFWIVGCDASAERYYTDVDYKGPLAIVIGNEGKGMRRLTKEKCDFLVKIPMYGKIDSLNASIAGALVMYEAARVRHIASSLESPLESSSTDF